MTNGQATATRLRRVFYRNVQQALKTKTGAVQTAAVKRIFHLAVLSLPDASLADLNRQLDYTPRGMTPAFYVNSAEALICKLVEQQPVPTLRQRLVESTPCQVSVLTKNDDLPKTSPTTSGRRSGSPGQRWRKSTGRGAGLAWVGRHPERETEETLARHHPPKLLREVVERMSTGGSSQCRG